MNFLITIEDGLYGSYCEAISKISLRIVAVSKSKPELLSTAVAKAKFQL